MAFDEDSNNKVLDLVDQLTLCVDEKESDMAIISISIVLLTTMINCEYSEEVGYEFLNNLRKDWKGSYSAIKKEMEGYSKNKDKTSTQGEII
jgi:hypothetical protein